MVKKLKRVRLKVNPDKGSFIEYISQVDKPAIERNFEAFKAQQVIHRFKSDDDLQEIFGPIMIPDMDIYRNSPVLGEYYAYFTVEDIKEAMMNFMEAKRVHNINNHHESEGSKSFLFESFQSSDKIPNPKGYEDLPLGTWYGRMKVTDKEQWSRIKSGEFKGFSVEGKFDFIIEEFEKHYLETHTTNYNIDGEKIINEMNFKKVLKSVFLDFANTIDEGEVGATASAPEEKFEEYKKVSSADFILESREAGSKIQTKDGESKVVDVPAGKYEFEDGFKFIVGEDSTIQPVIDNPQSAESMEEGDTQTPATTVPADELVKQMNERITNLESNLNYYNTRLGELETTIKAINQGFSSMDKIPTKEELNESILTIKTEFKQVFEKALSIPGEPTKNPTVKTKNQEQRDYQEFIALYSKL